MIEGGHVDALAGEQPLEILGTNEPGQDHLGAGLRTFGRRGDQFEQPAQLTGVDRLIDGPVSQRPERAGLETHLHQAQWLGLGRHRPVRPRRLEVDRRRQVFEHAAVGFRIRIFEPPVLEQAADLLAQLDVGARAACVRFHARRASPASSASGPGRGKSSGRWRRRTP